MTQRPYSLTVQLAEIIVIITIIMANDSQKAKSGLHAFLETLCAYSLLVAAGDAIVSEKL